MYKFLLQFLLEYVYICGCLASEESSLTFCSDKGDKVVN